MTFRKKSLQIVIVISGLLIFLCSRTFLLNIVWKKLCYVFHSLVVAYWLLPRKNRFKTRLRLLTSMKSSLPRLLRKQTTCESCPARSLFSPHNKLQADRWPLSKTSAPSSRICICPIMAPNWLRLSISEGSGRAVADNPSGCMSTIHRI